MDITTSAIAELIAKARERANKATAGPWEFDPDWVNRNNVVDSTGASLTGADYGGSVSYERKEDGEFVAHARTMVPTLADTLEAVTKERDKYKRRWIEFLKLTPKKETH